jgi:hypothetical protein
MRLSRLSYVLAAFPLRVRTTLKTLASRQCDRGVRMWYVVCGGYRGLLALELQLHLQLLQLAGRAGLAGAAAHARQLRQQLRDRVHHRVARRRR